MRGNMKSVRLFADKHMENIRSLFDTLYCDEKLADVTLCCKNGSIKAHKLILAASSPYFRKVFTENTRDHAVFIFHGIDFHQLKNLIELIYKGCVDIPSDTFNSIFDLAEEFDVLGVFVDGATSQNGADGTTFPNCNGRDTRFKGQKRVAVDYQVNNDNFDSPAKMIRSDHSRVRIFPKTEMEPEDDANEGCFENSNPNAKYIDKHVDAIELGPNKATSWAKKLRKFKCELCPSSFKRASHLTRHQLVHTGERPYACDQCDKAFSRHDKLKHHIKKTHEQELGDLSDQLNYRDSEEPDNALYTIGHVRILTPEPVQRNAPGNNSLPVKKGRGRPRKYPPVPQPLVKRPRGRPRLNPVVVPSVAHMQKRENYDITNLPFGDIEYLTKTLHDSNDDMEESIMMEPLVEIKTEPTENVEDAEKCNSNAFFDGIGLFENSVAKIGECTISMASTASVSAGATTSGTSAPDPTT